MRREFILGLLVFFAFAFAYTVSAASPFVSTQQTEGCEITSSLLDNMGMNKAHEFHFHVINKSSGSPMARSAGFQCIFHVYNVSGNHFIKNNSVNMDDTFDWYVFVPINTLKAGRYSYIFQCNTTNVGCFYDQIFVVTPSGNPPTGTGENLTLIVFLLGLAGVLALVSTSFESRHWFIKTVLLLAALLVFVIGASVCYNFVTTGTNGNLVTTTMVFIYATLGIVMIYLFVMYLKQIFKAVKDAKREKKEDFL